MCHYRVNCTLKASAITGQTDATEYIHALTPLPSPPPSNQNLKQTQPKYGITCTENEFYQLATAARSVNTTFFLVAPLVIGSRGIGF